MKSKYDKVLDLFKSRPGLNNMSFESDLNRLANSEIDVRSKLIKEFMRDFIKLRSMINRANKLLEKSKRTDIKLLKIYEGLCYIFTKYKSFYYNAYPYPGILIKKAELFRAMARICSKALLLVVSGEDVSKFFILYAKLSEMAENLAEDLNTYKEPYSLNDMLQMNQAMFLIGTELLNLSFSVGPPMNRRLRVHLDDECNIEHINMDTYSSTKANPLMIIAKALTKNDLLNSSNFSNFSRVSDAVIGHDITYGQRLRDLIGNKH